MVKIYMSYDSERDFGYFLRDVYEHLHSRGKYKAMDKLEEKLEACKNIEEGISIIRQFVVLVDTKSYRRDVEQMEQELKEKEKSLVLRAISENPGIRKDEIDDVTSLNYGNVIEAIIPLRSDKLIRAGCTKLRNGVEVLILYENIEKYKDIEEYKGW